MITSVENAQVKALVKLLEKAKERKKTNSFLVEGIRMFREVPKERLKAVYVSEKFETEHKADGLLEGVKYEVLSDQVFGKVSGTVTPQGILCVVEQKHYIIKDLLPEEKPALILVLESIQDPGNLGTMVRTGEGAGLSGILVNKTTVDLYNPKTVRSTMGSIYRMPFVVTEDLEESIRELQKRGVRFASADLGAKYEYDEADYRESCGFFIGNEGNGLSKEISDLADFKIRIPMDGQVESLNAAIAASICIYEAKRQRKNQ
jgi:RNA methyltransferase, TrmH family